MHTKINSEWQGGDGQSHKKLVLNEIVIVLSLLILFVIINIITSYGIQQVWLDEVTVADPAVNLYLGNGFTSTGWQYQTKEEFWASNAPLHQILLYHWMLIFGFNPIAVRSINYVLMAICVLTIWLAVTKLKLVTSSNIRIILIALILLGAGTTFNYVGGRYDCIGMSLFGGAFLAYTIKSTWLRCVSLTCIGIFIPIAGINLIFYGIILAFLLMVYLRELFIKEACCLAIGSTIGIIGIYILYLTNGVAKVILISMGGHGLSDSIGNEEIGTGSLNEKIVYVISNFPKILLNRLGNLPGWFWVDKSYVILIIVLVVIALYKIKNKQLKRISIVSFGLVASLCIPIILGILRNYPFYYSWMSYIPLAICTCSSLNEFAQKQHKAVIRLAISVLLILTCIPGYPMRLIASVKNGDFIDRDYGKVEKFIDVNIKINDKVYSDFEAYYAIKKKAEWVLLPTYKDVMSNQEKQEISAMVIKPENYAEVSTLLGGEWDEKAKLSESRSYKLKVYRRKK